MILGFAVDTEIAFAEGSVAREARYFNERLAELAPAPPRGDLAHGG